MCMCCEMTLWIFFNQELTFLNYEQFLLLLMSFYVIFLKITAITISGNNYFNSGSGLALDSGFVFYELCCRNKTSD